MRTTLTKTESETPVAGACASATQHRGLVQVPDDELSQKVHWKSSKGNILIEKSLFPSTFQGGAVEKAIISRVHQAGGSKFNILE